MTHRLKIGTHCVELHSERDLEPFARRWIAIGLCAWPADRKRFESAARSCYALARTAWHGHVIWVNSPAVLALTTAVIRHVGLQALAQRGLCAVEAQVRERLAEVVSGTILSAVYEAARAVCAALSSAPLRDPRTTRTRSDDDTGMLAGMPEHLATALRALLGRDGIGAVDELCRRVDGAVYRAAGALVDVEVERIWRALSCEPPAYLPGQLEVGRACVPACTSLLRERCGVELPGESASWARAFEEIAQSSGRWYAHRHFVLVCERLGAVHMEPYGRPHERAQRLHHLDGFALAWPDGWGLHAYHGVAVPAWLIERPQDITVAIIEQERNAEVRRVMLERFGWRRYFAQCGAVVVDSLPMDHPIVGLRGARLLRKELPGDEPLVYLEMVNSTPEPDGSYRRYLERIDPKVYFGQAGQLCHAAMASRWLHRDGNGELQRTFVNWEDYEPTAES